MVSQIIIFLTGMGVGAYAYARLTRPKYQHRPKCPQSQQSPKRTPCSEPKVPVHTITAEDIAKPQRKTTNHGIAPSIPLRSVPTSEPPDVGEKDHEEEVGPAGHIEPTGTLGGNTLPPQEDVAGHVETAADALLSEDLSDLSVVEKKENPIEKLLKEISVLSVSPMEGAGGARVKQALDHFLDDHRMDGNREEVLTDLLIDLGELAMDFEDQAESSESVRDVLQKAALELCDAMRHVGALDLNSSEGFSYSKHNPVNATGLLQDGHPIARFLTPGLSYNGRVVKRARVELI